MTRAVPRHRPAARTALRRRAAAVLAVPLLAVLAACGDAAAAGNGAGTAGTLRLGYFAGVTHAAAIVGVDRGLLADELGPTRLEPQVFNAGPAVVESLFAGALDAAFLGPGPAINAYGQSEGQAVRIVAGAAAGGAQLVVRPGIDSAQDLRGATLATPQLGNTQDVALRSWLSEQGLANSVEGGGDVMVAPTPNGDTLRLFQAGQLDGAWVPEPWASRLVLEAGGEVLVDERDLWPDGRFATTHLVVRTEFLEQNPGTVAALLRGHVEAVEWVEQNPQAAEKVVGDGILALTGRALPPAVLDRAWDAVEVTVDPIAASLQATADDAVTAGVLAEPVDLHGIYDLTTLNEILADRGRPAVSAGGLGTE